jgi:protein O-GlcNAc transferase
MKEQPNDMAAREAAARAALAADNLALAEAQVQDILRADPAHRFGRAVMAHVAALIGMEQAAAGWRDDGAERFDPPRAAGVTRLLAGAEASSHDDRWLLVKSWGHGFWSDAFHVLGAMMLAELTGRKPLVRWGDNALAQVTSGENAFPLYFAPVEEASFDAMQALPAEDIYPPKWADAGLAAEEQGKWVPPHIGGQGQMAALWLLNRPERLVVSDFYINVVDLLPWIPPDHDWYGRPLDEIVRALVGRYLAPTAAIVARVEEAREALADRRTLAVHIRGSDKAVEMTRLAEVNRLYDDLVAQAVERGYLVWLMTDESAVVERLRGRFGDAIICQDAMRTAGRRGVHFAAGRADRRRVGEEVVADVLVAAGCDRFIGNGASNPSCMVDFLMPGDETRKHLFVPNLNRGRLPSLYRDARGDGAVA